jgi:hypothetical protein
MADPNVNVKKWLDLLKKEDALKSYGEKIIKERIEIAFKKDQMQNAATYFSLLAFKKGAIIPEKFRGSPGMVLDKENRLQDDWFKVCPDTKTETGGPDWQKEEWSRSGSEWYLSGGHEQSWNEHTPGWDNEWGQSSPEDIGVPGRGIHVENPPDELKRVLNEKIKLSDFTEEERTILKRIGLK